MSGRNHGNSSVRHCQRKQKWALNLDEKIVDTDLCWRKRKCSDQGPDFECDGRREDVLLSKSAPSDDQGQFIGFAHRRSMFPI